MNVKVEFSRRKIEELSKLEGNPRKITADEMECLKESLTSIPEYMEAHPVVLSDRTGELVIIDGNQRMEAARQLGWVDVPTALMSGLTEEKEKEIIIRANVNNGEWDEELLSEWDAALLNDWGVDIPNSLPAIDFDSFFTNDGLEKKEKDEVIQVVIPQEYKDERNSIEERIKEVLKDYPNITIK